MQHLPKDDPELAKLIRHEDSRVENTLDLIAARPSKVIRAEDSMQAAYTLIRWRTWQSPEENNFLTLSISMFSLTAELQRTWRSIFPCSMLETESWQ